MSGLYIHIPYCKKACAYCDFYFSTLPKSRPRFLAALCKEMEIYARPETLETVYLGGGTPGILAEEELGQIFEALHKNFTVSPTAEITIEANPDDITPQKLKALKNLGVNRLSIGLQSFNDEELRWMNRAHNADEAETAVKEAQDAGFGNLSIDLIFASPVSTLDSLAHNLEKALSLQTPHISAYGMTIEARTKLGRDVARGHLAELPEHEFEKQFYALRDGLTQAGYEDYEISNFALPNFRARHNTAYWFQKPYLGLGPSAHGFDGQVRQQNLPNVHLYCDALEQNQKPIAETETLSAENRMNELIMTRLRLNEGLDLAEFTQKTGVALEQVKAQLIESYRRLGWLALQNGRLAVTRAGKLRVDGIAAALMFDVE